MGERQYKDMDGNKVSLYRLVIKEPLWAAGRIATMEAERVELLRDRQRLQAWLNAGWACVNEDGDWPTTRQELDDRLAELAHDAETGEESPWDGLDR